MESIDSIVKNGYLICPDFPAPLSLSSSEWQNWLERHAKFRYKGNNTTFTAFKDNRGYWVAQKRVEGKLRQKRLGNSQTLAKTSEAQLADIAQTLCAQDYERQKRDRDPDYLTHQITQLQAEVGQWKDKFYQARRDYQALELKLLEVQSYCETESERDCEVEREHLSEAVTILKQALKLRANAGGAIKDEIKIAITHLSHLLNSKD
jgi:hypothetical protein